MFSSTPHGVNTRMILILQNNLQGWMVGKAMMERIYVMFSNIKMFDNV